MPLTTGTRLGAYEILSLLGEGGMGQVYRARDTKLKREVAIKVLPEEFARDADRLARFRREAEVLATLNHPNIAAVYGLEETDSVTAIVMELVEGPTLADRISEGAVPVDQVLAIARQIADALEAAHERGVTHRDLKPANVKVRDDGVVKVLDFGLAKLTDPAAAATGAAAMNTQSPTLSLQATRAGVILGTAAYMSPEQARGKTVDKRTDIWAFGCVLYELLTGRLAFGGEEITDTLAFVITKDVDWAALPAETPAPIRKLLRRCLEKDRKKRLADIADARLELDEGRAAQQEIRPDLKAGPVTGKRTWPYGWIAAAVFLLTTLSLAGGSNAKYAQGYLLFMREATLNGENAAFEFGAARPLFQTRARTTGPQGNYAGYDVSADGQRFLVNTLVEDSAPAPITLVVNWTAGLRK